MKTLSVNNLKTVLSTCAAYKTAEFVKQTSAFYNIDEFLNKLSECLFFNKQEISNNNIYRLQINDSAFFFLKGSFCQSDLFINPCDIIFYRYQGSDAFIRRGDKRFDTLLRADSFDIRLIVATDDKVEYSQLSKLYRLSGYDGANFPLLNRTQKQVVTTEDKNMLVQGVAGSGKTNLCIDKILFSASRAYFGRVLYSTFSRGLLSDTKLKVLAVCDGIKKLAERLESNQVIFADLDKIKSIENKLGIYLPMGEEKMVSKLREIAQFLETKVDYYLIGDLYHKCFDDKLETATEDDFIKKYLPNIKNHNLSSRLDKIFYLSKEVIYKEIYGLISGFCNPDCPQESLSLFDYIKLRQDSFSAAECEIIYALSADYYQWLKKSNLIDNNQMTRQMLQRPQKQLYSLAILDEVQDMTQVNLVYFKSIARRLFCAGDALQMINASYFSFAYLKRLLYQKDLSLVAELKNNYRNDKKIADIADGLGELNSKFFGVHSFVLKSESQGASTKAAAVFLTQTDFFDKLNKEPFNNYTIVVSNQEEKQKLRKRLEKQEILTVAEIKGLERETVILYNLVSSNLVQWQAFERLNINRKNADENSVFRYYFNLLYVGVSRAKTQLYVLEEKKNKTFDDFFKNSFLVLNSDYAIKRLLSDADKTEAEQDDILTRIKTFIGLGQYDNAIFLAQKIISESEKNIELNRIDIAKTLIHKGKHKEAGIRFLQLNMFLDAKEQFVLCGEESLVKLAQICQGSTNQGVGLEVLSAFAEIESKTARDIILGIVENDLQSILQGIGTVSNGLKQINGKHIYKNKGY